ncbi:MAG TPA: ParB/RepB/Spo0J family partition protein [Candidatus Paceibacterota bacterium]|nr:ParB/RepB/Spo0J family partition protein [Candidatus Paceibacterota bacterium]
MLGKGLESLIPQKGNQGGTPPGNGAGTPDGRQPSQGQTSNAPISQQPEIRPQEHEPNKAERPAAQPPAGGAPITPAIAQKNAPVNEHAESDFIFHLELDKIKPNPDQPRRHFDESALKDLANSIREFGILQPLVVSKVDRETPSGIEVEYQLIAGERRYLAAKLLGLLSVPAIVRNVSLEREKLELAVIENIQRENLNPIETARAFVRLQEEFHMTQREIAAKLGKSREVVANAMRLLDLPDYVREAVEKGALSESHARLLLSVNDLNLQKQLFDDILANNLTTRDVKERVQRTTTTRRGRPPLIEGNIPPEMKMLQEELSSSLGAPVEIRKGGNTGRITITFYSEEELESILKKLKREREGM